MRGEITVSIKYHGRTVADAGGGSSGDVKELMEALDQKKQDLLIGQPGQVVGFDTSGTAEAVPGWSNPNLLDNWYFADPINQRGQKEYTKSGYTFDRWKLDFSSSCSVSLIDGGVELHNNSGTTVLMQPLEDDVEKCIRGAQVTFSALTTSGELKYQTVTIPNAGAADTSDLHIGDWHVDIQGKPNLSFRLYSIAPDSAASVRAVKLELGARQTLAHQDVDGSWVLNDPPPDKALELAKCQRYWVSVPVSITDSNRMASYFIINVKWPVEMRATPTVSIEPKDVNGVKHPNSIISNWDGLVYQDLKVVPRNQSKKHMNLLNMTQGTIPTNFFGATTLIADANL